MYSCVQFNSLTHANELILIIKSLTSVIFHGVKRFGSHAIVILGNPKMRSRHCIVFIEKVDSSHSVYPSGSLVQM